MARDRRRTRRTRHYERMAATAERLVCAHGFETLSGRGSGISIKAVRIRVMLLLKLFGLGVFSERENQRPLR